MKALIEKCIGGARLKICIIVFVVLYWILVVICFGSAHFPFAPSRLSDQQSNGADGILSGNVAVPPSHNLRGAIAAQYAFSGSITQGPHSDAGWAIGELDDGPGSRPLQPASMGGNGHSSSDSDGKIAEVHGIAQVSSTRSAFSESTMHQPSGVEGAYPDLNEDLTGQVDNLHNMHTLNVDDQNSIGNVAELRGCSDKPTVTIGTIYSPAFDRLPLATMLHHQMRGATQCMHLLEVLVAVNPEGISEDEAVREVEATLPVPGRAVLMRWERRDDPQLLASFSDGAFGPTLSSLYGTDFDQAAQYTHGVLEFILNCRTEFCVWLDVDMLVHRPMGEPGWLDIVLDQLILNSSVAHASLGFVDLSEHPTGFSVQVGNMLFDVGVEGVSSRCMVLRRSSMLTVRPLNFSCQPSCTFEEAYRVPLERANGFRFRFGTNDGVWISHPPEDDGSVMDYMHYLKECGQGNFSRGLDLLIDEVEHRRSDDGHIPFSFGIVDGAEKYEGEVLELASLRLNCINI